MLGLTADLQHRKEKGRKIKRKKGEGRGGNVVGKRKIVRRGGKSGKGSKRKAKRKEKNSRRKNGVKDEREKGYLYLQDHLFST